MFFGNRDSCALVKRGEFNKTRSSLRLYSCYNVERSVADALWHLRIVLNNFQHTAATVAVPNGVLLLGKNTIRCKGRTCALSSVNSEPVKFGIRKYSFVKWRSCYLYFLAENNSGNRTGINQAELHVTTFRELRGTSSRKMNNSLLNKNSGSALWAPQAKIATIQTLRLGRAC